MVDEQSLFGRAPSVGDEEDSGEKDTQYEVVSLAKLSGPLILAYTLTYLTNVVDLAMAGHLGTDELASVSLGMVVYTVWFDPLIGLSSAMQTLFTQAYGARRMGLYAQWLLVGSVVLLVAAVPTAVLLFETESLLLLLYPDQEQLCASTGLYVRLLLFGLAPQLVFVILTKYLNSQHILWPCVIIAAAVNVFNITVQWLFIYHFQWGIVGAPLATSLTRLVHALALVIFICLEPSSWAGWPTLADLEWRRFRDLITLGTAGWAMEALECWGLQGTAVLASFAGVLTLSANNVVLSIVMLLYLGLLMSSSLAGGIRVGHLLGAGEETRARRVAVIAVCWCAGVVTPAAGVVALCHDVVGRLYSHDEAVVVKVSEIVPIVALGLVFFGVFAGVAGVLRGMGKQSIVLLLNVTGIWAVGLGGGYLLMFPGGMGLAGLWWAITAGLLLAAGLGLFVIFLVLDWGAAAAESAERMKLNGDGNKQT